MSVNLPVRSTRRKKAEEDLFRQSMGFDEEEAFQQAMGQQTLGELAQSWADPIEQKMPLPTATPVPMAAPVPTAAAAPVTGPARTAVSIDLAAQQREIGKARLGEIGAAAKRFVFPYPDRPGEQPWTAEGGPAGGRDILTILQTLDEIAGAYLGPAVEAIGVGQVPPRAAQRLELNQDQFVKERMAQAIENITDRSLVESLGEHLQRPIEERLIVEAFVSPLNLAVPLAGAVRSLKTAIELTPGTLIVSQFLIRRSTPAVTKWVSSVASKLRTAARKKGPEPGRPIIIEGKSRSLPYDGPLIEDISEKTAAWMGTRAGTRFGELRALPGKTPDQMAEYRVLAEKYIESDMTALVKKGVQQERDDVQRIATALTNKVAEKRAVGAQLTPDDILAVADEVAIAMPGGVPKVAPRVLVPDDPSQYGQRIYAGGTTQPSGEIVRGTPISLDDPVIPDTVYHMTTNAPAVRSSGMLRASGEGGLGGAKRDQIVSFTIDRDIAYQLVDDMKLASEIARMGRGEWKTPERIAASKAILRRLMQAMDSEGWSAVEPYAGNFSRYMDDPKISYLHGDYTANEWLSQYFTIRSSATAKLGAEKRNPLVFTDIEALARVNPDNIDVIAVPKSALRTGAMVTDLDLANRVGLQEIRIYGDVPVAPAAGRAPEYTDLDVLLGGLGAERGRVPRPTQIYREGVHEPVGDPVIKAVTDKWASAKARNSATAATDLKRLKDDGYDVSEATEALEAYKNTKRADFDNAEDYSEARTEAWDEFINQLDVTEKPDAPSLPAAVPEAPTAAAQRSEELTTAVQSALSPEFETPETILAQADLRVDEARAALTAAQAPIPAHGTPERLAYNAARKAARDRGEPLPTKRQLVKEATKELEAATAFRTNAAKDAGIASGPPGGPPSLPGDLNPDDPDFHGKVLAWFKTWVSDPQHLENWPILRQWRSDVLAGRFANVQDAIPRLLAQGYTENMAIEIAKQFLRGELPTLQTGIQLVVTPTIERVLYEELYRQLKNDVPELLATHTALGNALAGGGIPATPGGGTPTGPFPEGGSALLRLQFVFGDEIVAALPKKGETLTDTLVKRATKPKELTPFEPIGPMTDYPSTQVPGSIVMRGRLEGRGEMVPGQPTERLIPEEEGAALQIPEQPLAMQQPWEILIGPTETNLLSPIEQEMNALAFSEFMGKPFQVAGIGDVPGLARQIDPLTGELEMLEVWLQRRMDIAARTTEQYPEEEVRALVSEEEAARAVDVVTGMTAGGQPRRSLQVQDPYLDAPPPETPPGPFEESWFAQLPPKEQAKRRKELQQIVKRFEGFSAEDKIQMIRWAKEAGLTAIDFGNLLRANMASVDMSYLRQQAMLIPGNPVAFAKSFPRAVRAMWTDDYALNLELARKNTSLYRNYYSKGADFLRELGTPESNIWALEEEFLVLSGDRPLQKLARKLPWLNISNRAFITGTNEMNWDIYEGHLRTLIHHNEQFRAGHLAGQPVEYADLRTPSYWPFTPGIKDKLLSEADIQRSMNNVAEMLAEMSARGPMGVSWKKQSLKDYHSFLNAAFFSFRSTTGRLLSPRHMMSGDPFVRRAAWKNMLTFVGSMMGIILAGERMGAWETETDCRSSEFMKIKLAGGRLSIDAWGGTQQYAVLYCRLMPGVGGIKGLDYGDISDFDPATGVGRFSRNKASPGLGAALMIFYGKDFRGTEVDRRDAKMWIENHYPMSVQDAMEAYESAGLLGLYVGAPVGIFGGGLIARDLTLNDVAMREYGVSYSDLSVLESWERKAGKIDRRAEVRKMWELDLTEAEQERIREKELKQEQTKRDRDERRREIGRKLDEEAREGWGGIGAPGQYAVPPSPRVTPPAPPEPGGAIGGGSIITNFPAKRPVGR